MTTAPNADTVINLPEKTTQPVSIKSFLSQPKVLLTSLIFSAILNLVLFVSVIAISGGSNKPTVSPTVTTKPSSPISEKPTSTIRPTPRPSSTHSEILSEWQDCFNYCNTEDLLAKIRSKAVDYTDFKAQITFHNRNTRICYGNYLESSSPFREFNSYQHNICEESFVSRPPQTTVHIADNLYTLNTSGNWNLESMPRVSQTKLIRVIDQVIEQQEKTVEEGTRKSNLKEIRTKNKIVTDQNQLVNKTATLVINDVLDVISYEIETEGVSKESGYFFGLGITNTIESPL